MTYNNLIRLNFIFSVVLFFILSLTIHTNDSNDSPKISVTMLTDSEFSETEKFVYDIFQKVLKEMNLYSETDFQIEYLIDAKSIENDEGSRLIISVTTLQTLPEEVIDINKKAQSFYFATAKQDLPNTPEGTRIREYVSEEFINQVRIVINNYIDIINKSEIEDYLKNIIKEIKSK